MEPETLDELAERAIAAAIIAEQARQQLESAHRVLIDVLAKAERCPAPVTGQEALRTVLAVWRATASQLGDSLAALEVKHEPTSAVLQ
mgnify:CR=1 FL=1